MDPQGNVIPAEKTKGGPIEMVAVQMAYNRRVKRRNRAINFFKRPAKTILA
jgi:hypothetical protein